MRIVSWFSCGAASAIATLMAAVHYEKVQAVYCKVKEEHEDNFRFMTDFTEKTKIPVKIIINNEFEGSIFNVFLKRKFIKNQYGAPCTMLLKKHMREQYQQPDDIQIFGFTSDEQARADRFIDANNDVNERFILIDNNVSKADCFEYLKFLNIELPMMYKLGYSNNNCIGCVKGGMGYWNQIRKDFPDRFSKMAKLERLLGHAINKDKNGPVFLDVLSPKRGNKQKDAPGNCGFVCEQR